MTEWPTFTFPPLNLWNMQLHGEIVKLINKYYYEHYKDLFEETHKDDEFIGNWMVQGDE